MQIAYFSKICYILILVFTSCNLEVNTVDPQVSDSEESSKENGFFISSYYSHNPKDSLIILENAWVEYCWKNKATLLKKSKVKTQGIQLNIKVNNIDASLNKSKYLTNWRMEVDNIGVLGRSNLIYTVYINSAKVPDSITFQTKTKSGEQFINRNHFTLYRIK